MPWRLDAAYCIHCTNVKEVLTDRDTAKPEWFYFYVTQYDHVMANVPIACRFALFIKQRDAVSYPEKIGLV